MKLSITETITKPNLNTRKAMRFILKRFPRAFSGSPDDRITWEVWLHTKFMRPIVGNSFGDEANAWCDAAESLGWKGRL